MKTTFYSLFFFQAFLLSNAISFAQDTSAKQQAYAQSVSSTSGESESAAGTFRTMESVRYGMLHGYSGVTVKVEQPMCSGHSGTLSLINPSGEAWKYKVIEKNGNLISEGDVGYDRRISKLNAGNYLIQFKLANGISALDEFSIKPGIGLEASILMDNSREEMAGNLISFSGKCDGGSEFIWDFGDGDIVYGGQSVEHAFAKPGVYTVHFTANNFDCTSQVTTKVSIIQQPLIVSGE
jgi:hypothetical protein